MTRCSDGLYNLPTPGMGEQGVLGIAPCRTEADSADLSGGPPGAERGTCAVGRATRDRRNGIVQNNYVIRPLGFPLPSVVFDDLHRGPGGSSGGGSTTDQLSLVTSPASKVTHMQTAMRHHT